MKIPLRCLMLCGTAVLLFVRSPGCENNRGGSTSAPTAGIVDERTENDPTPGLPSEGKLPRQYRR
jgi:hypothetical protein